MALAQDLTSEQLTAIIELFDATEFGLALVDPDGHLIGVNQALATLFDYEAEELLGQPAEVFWQGFRQHYQYHLFFINLAERKNWQGELLCKSRKGTIFPVKLTWQFHPEDPGIAIGIFNDLTDQKRWESRILEARDRAERFLDISQAMIVSLNREGEIAEINRRGCEILGYDATDLVGQNWFELAIPAPNREEELSRFQRILSNEEPPPSNLETEVITQSGESRFILWNHSLVVDEMDEIKGTLSSGQDISRRKAAEQEIFRLAMTDHLTGLLNRRSFYQRFEDSLKLAKRNQLTVATIAIDLDQFKPINDQFGHEMGDKVLIHIAQLLRENFRETDIIGRLGGDEFAVIAVLSGKHPSLEDALQRLLKFLRSPIHIDGQTLSLGASIGVAYFPDNGDEVEDLMRKSDQALYQAKHGGRNRVEHYQED